MIQHLQTASKSFCFKMSGILPYLQAILSIYQLNFQ